jgi:predicted negative regulator of RcsB-dependent stress response
MLEGVNVTPTHIVYDPRDLKEISRANTMSAKQIEDAIAEAQKKIGKPVRWREYSKLRETLDAASKYVGEKDWRKALKELRDFDPGEMKNLATEADALRKQILDAGRARLDEAKAAIEAGDTKKAGEVLREVRRDFGGTEIEDQAKELQATLKE